VSAAKSSPVIALTIAIAGCAALEAYSIRVAERCEDVSVCTVYGPSGEHPSPCISTGRQTIYPGDPHWPYTTPGLCDAVVDGKVVSTRETTPAANR
jgi:hypothetical protein